MAKLHICDVLERLVICEPATMETGCWEWRGWTQGGYGRVAFQGRNWLVHRLIYEHFAGEIPDDMQTDHLCRNRCCSNFEHLEAVTGLENIRRGRPYNPRTIQTHCKRGHPLSGDNLYIFPNSGARRCKSCIRSAEQQKAMEAGMVAHSRKTHCPQGHPYEGSNLYVTKSGKRMCKTCCRDRMRNHYWVKKEAEIGSSSE